MLAEAPLHGYALIEAVEQRSSSGVLLDPANLYRVLRRMNGLGWIQPSGRPDGSDRDAEGGVAQEALPWAQALSYYHVLPTNRCSK